jgi:hypothetical protein
MIAMARRAGVKLGLDEFDALARQTPLLANIRPSGNYLMEDFYYAGVCARCSSTSEICSSSAHALQTEKRWAKHRGRQGLQ